MRLTGIIALLLLAAAGPTTRTDAPDPGGAVSVDEAMARLRLRQAKRPTDTTRPATRPVNDAVAAPVEPAIRVRPGAPPEVAALLVKSEALKSAYLKEIPKEIQAAKLDLAKRRAARVTAGGGNGVSYPNDPARRVYTFGSLDDKARSVAEQENQIKRLEETLGNARDPKKIALSAAGENELKIGFIGQFFGLEILQVLGPDSARVNMLPVAPGGEGYLPDSVQEAIITGWDTTGLTDGKVVLHVPGCFRISGTKRYQTVLAGSRTVLEVKPFNVDDWVDR